MKLRESKWGKHPKLLLSGVFRLSTLGLEMGYTVVARWTVSGCKVVAGYIVLSREAG